MPNVAVQKVTEEKSMPSTWLEAIRSFSERVRAKAFDLFEKNGRQEGHAVDHWLEAEQELMSVPRCEVNDTGSAVELRIDAPEFQAKQIEVSALPDTILIRAAASEEREETKGGVFHTESYDRSFFRRIQLSKPIDVNSVTAKLDKGVLNIAAKRRAEGKIAGAGAGTGA